MAITIASNATQVSQSTPESESSADWLRLLQLLRDGSKFPDGQDGFKGPGTHTVTRMYEYQTRSEGENISYGKAVRIDQNNLSQLGLKDISNLDTYSMDSEGNMTHTAAGINDFSDVSNEAFLVQMDGDARAWNTDGKTGDITVTSTRNDAPMAMTIQRVEVNGVTQGYYLAGEDKKTGIYLDASALDYSKMSDEIKQQLKMAETPESPQVANRQPEISAGMSVKL